MREEEEEEDFFLPHFHLYSSAEIAIDLKATFAISSQEEEDDLLEEEEEEEGSGWHRTGEILLYGRNEDLMNAFAHT